MPQTTLMLLPALLPLLPALLPFKALGRHCYYRYYLPENIFIFILYIEGTRGTVAQELSTKNTFANRGSNRIFDRQFDRIVMR